VGVNVGLNPDTRKLLIYGGVAALALLAMASLRRR
jgi:MYXO-CTERM domain-containing protein